MLNDESAVVHDFSALEAATGRKNAGSKARLYISSGLGLLLAGAGLGLGAYGLSYVIPPKIVETTKIVTETKVERIEVPKIVENQTVKIVEVPKFIGGVETRVLESPTKATQPTKPTNASETHSQVSETRAGVSETTLGSRTRSPTDSQSEPRAAPADSPSRLRVGAAFTPRSFALTKDFINSQCSGRLVSHIEGRLLFDNGVTCYDATPSGEIDVRVTSTRHNGDMATCADTGRRFRNGAAAVDCFALHNGWVERIRETTAPDTASRNDPIQELMNPN